MFACSKFVCRHPLSVQTCFGDHLFQDGDFVDGCLYCDNYDCEHCGFFNRDEKRCNCDYEGGDHE